MRFLAMYDTYKYTIGKFNFSASADRRSIKYAENAVELWQFEKKCSVLPNVRSYTYA